jgi:lipopolysaccharide/colanic/teichoic acid biosynthesis glycosyltransferase
MRPIFQSRTAILFIGDIVVFGLAVWISLVLRNLQVPNYEILEAYVLAFSILFGVWALVFVVAGLYEKRVLVYKRVHGPRLALTSVVNVLAAALFFFLVPQFGITPKTILVIYLIVSIILIFLWRLVVFPQVFGLPAQTALVAGTSRVLDVVERELRGTAIFRTERLDQATLESGQCVAGTLDKRIAEQHPDLVILDLDHPAITAALPRLYSSLAHGTSFVAAADAYEDMFGRVPLETVTDQWVIQNLSHHQFYDGVKRVFDMVVAGIGLVVSAVLFPFIALAILFDCPGPVFIAQDRVGQYDRRIRLYKFRSMERNDTSLSADKPANRVTRVGAILRKSRFDELPQLWNVVRGDLSLIGPRPELPAGVKLYEREIAHYGIRHLIKPGLSGWAQLYHDAHPHHTADIEATREKLSFDLYYLKHRSLVLDVLVGLKTVRKMLSQSGS